MQENEISALQALDALNRAALAISGELDSDRVLQQIVDAARTLVDAKYAALGVPGHDGTLVRFLTSGMEKQEEEKIAHPPIGKGLLGLIINEGISIRVKNISEDPRSAGFPKGHPPMNSFLGVPIIGAGETLGNLYLTEKLTSDEFSESDQRLVEMLAAHAAIAIQNAKLYEQVERLAILEERARIGMDLHDGVIQSIYAVGLTLESVHLSLENDPDLGKLLSSAIEGLNDAIRDIRNFILDLRPRRFTGDLSHGLARLVREFQANTMVPVTMTVPQKLDGLPLPTARAVFLTTQESLANIARHARAENVILNLLQSDSFVTLIVEDDGRGFDTEDGSRQVGHGLANMQARAEDMGGKFSIGSTLGKGTTITLKLPT